MPATTRDYRDNVPRLKWKPLMAGKRIPATLPCVVVDENAVGVVRFVHYDGGAFIVQRSHPSWYTAEAWGDALAYAKQRGLPAFRTGDHESLGEKVKRVT